MSLSITGLHHVTAIATDPQRNLDFYAGLLGLRLVKRTVFEIATDPPGFTTDERLEELGLNLRLPPQPEPMRSQLEAVLPPITLPQGTAA